LFRNRYSVSLFEPDPPNSSSRADHSEARLELLFCQVHGRPVISTQTPSGLLPVFKKMAVYGICVA
jgi:hypothetical protein